MLFQRVRRNREARILLGPCISNATSNFLGIVRGPGLTSKHPGRTREEKTEGPQECQDKRCSKKTSSKPTSWLALNNPVIPSTTSSLIPRNIKHSGHRLPVRSESNARGPFSVIMNVTLAETTTPRPIVSHGLCTPQVSDIYENAIIMGVYGSHDPEDQPLAPLQLSEALDL